MYRIFLFLISTFVFTSCSTKMTMCPRELEGQSLIYCDGIESVLSNEENSSVVFIPPKAFTYSERPSIIFSIANTSEEQMEVSEEDIAVTVNGDAVHVYTHEELLKEEARRQKFATAALLLNVACAALNTYRAGESTTYGTYSDYRGGYGNYSAHTYNPSQQRIAMDVSETKNLLLVKEFSDRHQATLAELANNYLKRNTLLPGQQIGGRVEISKLKPPKEAKEMMVTLDVGPDHHEFVLEFDKRR